MLVALAVPAVLTAPLTSAADPAATTEPGWQLGLSLTSGVTTNEQVGSFESYVEGSDPREEVNAAGKGSESAIAPFAGASLELRSPAITLFPGSPRVFAAVEVLPTFTGPRRLASQGDPGEFAFPDGNFVKDLSDADRRAGLQRIPVETLMGRGDEITASVMTVAWAAGIGAAFPLEAWGRRLSLRPYAGWIRYGVLIEGVVRRPFKTDVGDGQSPFGQEYRAVVLSRREVLFFNGLGPGFELEMEVGRWGAFQPSIFVGGAAYRVLGNRRLEVSAAKSYPELFEPFPAIRGGDVLLPAVRNTATWSIDIAPWLYRAGVGLRVRWPGK